MVQGKNRVPSGLRYENIIVWPKVCKGNLVVQGLHKVPSGPRNAKGT